MQLSSTKKVYLVVSILVLVLVTTPYFYASFQGGDAYQFGGFLLNPLDGNSYLAKMRQGWNGSWKFTLPYTANPGKGAYLFLFYISLGHLARTLQIPLLIMFHGVKFIGTALMLTSMARFFDQRMESPRLKQSAFSLAAIGSGLGWTAIPWGLFTADFWVAEAYPFLSAYANPHFPLGLAILMNLFQPAEKRRISVVGILTALLALILPFGVVILILLHGALVLDDFFSGPYQKITDVFKTKHMKSVGVIGGIGLPILVYEWWVTNADPVLSLWNEQNLTPSPPLWDTLLSFSPALILAIWGIRKAWGSKKTKPLVYWGILGAVLMYFPWSLQRRFMLGYYIPMAGLAVLGIERISKQFALRFPSMMIVLIIFAVPTNAIVILSGAQAVKQRSPQIYLAQNEVQALEWVEKNAQDADVFLSSPSTGLYIPAYTGRKVYYGHPFETTDAEEKRGKAEGFFKETWTSDQRKSFLVENEIDYVFYGPREKKLGAVKDLAYLEVVYDRGGIKIYEVDH